MASDIKVAEDLQLKIDLAFAR